MLIMAHRPAAIQECDMLLVIEGGTQAAFGPKDKVLSEMVANHKNIQAAAKQSAQGPAKTGGVA